MHSARTVLTVVPVPARTAETVVGGAAASSLPLRSQL